MKFLKIFFLMMFVFAIAACGGSGGSIYDYPDDEPEAKKGKVGDPCEKNPDCEDGLLCIKKVCTDPHAKDDADNTDDSDISDSGDSQPDGGDSQPDSGDSGNNDGDNSDSAPDNDGDSDEPVYVPECGNGIVDPGEKCDEGINNNNDPGSYEITCRPDCTFARCGDGITDNGEACDDGNNYDGDYCSADCKKITGFCGDGTEQFNEECDPVDNPYCNDECTELTGFCGDGTKQSNEKCDNAEKSVGKHEGIGPYYCNLNCLEIIGSCGDSDQQPNEACDDGDNNGYYGFCKADCSGKGPYCGDGIRQSNEACDDGNNEENDYCSADCKTYRGECGDGKIVPEAGEACDKANFGSGTGAYCSDDCKEIKGACGDGTKQPNEECDRGTANGNAECPYPSATTCKLCSTNCRLYDGLPRFCGDGKVTSQYEECDKADFDEGIGRYCSDDCKTIIGSCGDGKVQANEACDNALPSVGKKEGIGSSCSGDCQKVIGSCGDGKVQTNEACDEGSANGRTDCDYSEQSCQLCSDDCTLENGTVHYCGDGQTETTYGEKCDDGFDKGKYGKCKADCSGIAAKCGDGKIHRSSVENCGTLPICNDTLTENCCEVVEFLEGYEEEECDLGDKNGSKECPYGNETCQTCSSECKLEEVPGTWCGDGTVNGNETCDDGVNDGSYGHCGVGCYGNGERCGDGKLNGSETCDDGVNDGSYGGCLSDCSFGPRCGDGTVDTDNGEACDDGTSNGHYAFYAPGTCNENCTGHGDGGYCGDGITNGDETCDDKELNGRTTCEYGVTSCVVCNSGCQQTTITTGTSYCGDGIVDEENGEACDDRNNNDGDYCSADCKTITGFCGDGKVQDNEGCDNAAPSVEPYEGIGTYCSADCATIGGYCGDGRVQTNEEACDDGNNEDGDYCSADCKTITGFCGDGKVQEIEECDNADPSVEPYEGIGAYCSDTCDRSYGSCGDGEKNGDEECDFEGDNGNMKCAYGLTECSVCTDNCELAKGETSYCGDETTDTANGEECDDGELNGTTNHCNEYCSGYMPRCGDKTIQRADCTGYENCVVEPHMDEECDEGDELNGQYGHCNSSCSAISFCGDGIRNGSEICDSGVFNGVYSIDEPNCNGDCSGLTAPHCGDKIIQSAECDPEDTACVSNEDAHEQCDNGTLNGSSDCAYIHDETECFVCSNECMLQPGTAHFCGDKHVDDGEEVCDEGAILNGSGYGHCNSNCSGIIDWRCGDGKVDFDEKCDDGDGVNGTYMKCKTDCSGIVNWKCGDGIVQRKDCSDFTGYCVEVPELETDEVCDDYDLNGTYNHCNSDCTGMNPARCGDGIIQRENCTGVEGTCEVLAGAYEFCDDGDGVNGTHGHCNLSCAGRYEAGYCGDGKLQKKSVSDCPSGYNCSTPDKCCVEVPFAEGDEAETCDEGDSNGLHGHCNLTCSGESSCGDGEIGKDEICEPGEMQETIPCAIIAQFKGSGIINTCDDNCMPIIGGVCENADSFTPSFFETMQTLCYDNNSVMASCPASGEPFFGQEPNLPRIEHEFTTDSENPEVVTEEVSQLVWQKATPSSYDGCLNGSSCTYDEALAYCENSTTGGYDDWRLPTAHELSTIADYASSPHLYSGFDNTHGGYWTIEKIVFSSANGTAAPSNGTAQVKCVRSDNSSCSVLQCRDQQLIHVVALDSSVIMSSQWNFAFWYFGETKQSESWENALAICESINYNGINKMRLPTVTELIRLFDVKKGGSLIPDFNDTAWTSTTSSTNEAEAYVVNFGTSSIALDSKLNSNIVICVE